MEFLRKLKKRANAHAGHRDHSPPPRPRGRQPMMDYGPLPRSFFNAVNSAREHEGHDALPVFPRGPIPNGEEYHVYEEPDNDFPTVDRSRSKSRERPVDRSVRSRSRGTPVKFRRRPVSPESLQPRASSPHLFRQHSLPIFPDMQRHFQLQPQPHPQLFHMRMAQPAQFYPQFQQQFYPMMNANVQFQPWFMMRQPQMYPLY